MSPILGIFASQGRVSPNSYESIATTTVGSGGQATITFSSIPSTFKHLQIRYIAGNSSTSAGNLGLYLKINSDTTAGNYAVHAIQGVGSVVEVGNTTSSGDANGSAFRYGIIWGNSVSDKIYSVGVIDFLDYANTNKNKTIRQLRGVDANGSTGGRVGLDSMLWASTSAINSLVFTVPGYNLVENTQFALYGIK